MDKYQLLDLTKYEHFAESDLEGWCGGCSPLFYNHLFFCDLFEELHIVFIEVRLIINNAPLT